MRYMLDTNICIYAIKQKPYQVFARLQKTDPADVCVSSITYAELLYGVENSQLKDKNRLALVLLLANIPIMSFDAEAAECYGTIRGDLNKRGMLIGDLDMLIAGHAQSLNCALVTNNEREFSRVKNLKIANWAS